MEINCILSKNIHSMSINVLVTHKEGGFSLFCLLFGVVSGLFQPVLACYSLLQVVPRFTRDDVTECFDLQIYYKSTSWRCCYKVGQLYYKVEQLLQSGTVFISNWGRYYKTGQLLPQSRSGITRCGNYYQYRRQMRETGKSNIFLQSTP